MGVFDDWARVHRLDVPKKSPIANHNTRYSGLKIPPAWVQPKVWDGMPETAPVRVGVSL